MHHFSHDNRRIIIMVPKITLSAGKAHRALPRSQKAVVSSFSITSVINVKPPHPRPDSVPVLFINAPPRRTSNWPSPFLTPSQGSVLPTKAGSTSALLMKDPFSFSNAAVGSKRSHIWRSCVRSPQMRPYGRTTGHSSADPGAGTHTTADERGHRPNPANYWPLHLKQLPRSQQQYLHLPIHHLDSAKVFLLPAVSPLNSEDPGDEIVPQLVELYRLGLNAQGTFPALRPPPATGR